MIWQRCLLCLPWAGLACALRALDFTGPTLASHVGARNAAGRGWLGISKSLQPCRSHCALAWVETDRSYWRQVLEYGAEGCLQSVLDEYVHILKDSLGPVGEEPEEMVEDIAETIQTALTVRSSCTGCRRYSGRKWRRNGTDASTPVTLRHAFGQGRDEEKWRHSCVTCAEGARGIQFTILALRCYLDLYWPGRTRFSLVLPCHRALEFTANPVDLEQREGRVHHIRDMRYEKTLRVSMDAMP